jgi:hypothetical protein
MPRKYSRQPLNRRSSKKAKKTTKKNSKQRPKSKKMRGGVTTRSSARRWNGRRGSAKTLRVQDLTKLPSDVFGEKKMNV